MKLPHATTLRTRLTFFYVAVLAVLLLLYAALVFALQYAVLTRQLLHDEVQDVVTVEGLLYFDNAGQLQLHQDYYSRPQSHLLVDRLMEVRDTSNGAVLYRSPNLIGMALGGPLRPGEGDAGFDERRIRLANGTHVFIVSHIHGMNGHTLVIRLGYELTPFRQRMQQFLLLLLLGIPLALALAWASGQFIAKRALRPLDRMTARAQGITASNLHDRLDVPNPNDELGHMATVFNGLLERLEQAFLQLQRFTADVAHELRTPIASLRAMGEIALQQPHTADSYRSTLSDILEATARLNDTIDSLLLLSRAEAIQPGERATTFPLRPLVSEVITLLEVIMEERGLRVLEENATAGQEAVYADRTLLRVAILNVLHNAVKFSPPNGLLCITYEISKEEPAQIRLFVRDQGPGITAGDHKRVFDRFFTSSVTSSTGTGLGLAIAKLIIDRTGGSIAFDDACTDGASCVIELPLATARSNAD